MKNAGSEKASSILVKETVFASMVDGFSSLLAVAIF